MPKTTQLRTFGLQANLRPMITRSEMFTPLLEADPSFKERWQRFLADYADQPEPPIYIALGELAEHLVESRRRGDVERFDRVFETVERWHTEGDAYVSEAALIGLPESLQGILGGNDRTRAVNGVTASDFEPYFGPETTKWWDKLDRFWEGDTTALRLDI